MVELELTNIDQFCHMVCTSCTANDWYCPSYCEMLEKAHRIPFDKIVKSYLRNDGDVWKVVRYIKRYKAVQEKILEVADESA